MRKCLGAALVALLAPVLVHAEESTDVFGFQKFFKTKETIYDWVKDPAKMLAFVQAVQAWDAANPRLSFLESLHPELHGEGDA